MAHLYWAPCLSRGQRSLLFGNTRRIMPPSRSDIAYIANRLPCIGWAAGNPAGFRRSARLSGVSEGIGRRGLRRVPDLRLLSTAGSAKIGDRRGRPPHPSKWSRRTPRDMPRRQNPPDPCALCRDLPTIRALVGEREEAPRVVSWHMHTATPGQIYKNAQLP